MGPNVIINSAQRNIGPASLFINRLLYPFAPIKMGRSLGLLTQVSDVGISWAFSDLMAYTKLGTSHINYNLKTYNRYLNVLSKAGISEINLPEETSPRDISNILHALTTKRIDMAQEILARQRIEVKINPSDIPTITSRIKFVLASQNKLIWLDTTTLLRIVNDTSIPIEQKLELANKEKLLTYENQKKLLELSKNEDISPENFKKIAAKFITSIIKKEFASYTKFTPEKGHFEPTEEHSIQGEYSLTGKTYVVDTEASEEKIAANYTGAANLINSFPIDKRTIILAELSKIDEELASGVRPHIELE